MRTLQQSWIESGLIDENHPLRDTTVIVGQNAWEYCLEQGYMWNSEFIKSANIAPPFDSFFVEYTARHQKQGYETRVGFLFQTEQTATQGWDCMASMYLDPKFQSLVNQRRNLSSKPLASIRFAIDGKGRFIDSDVVVDDDYKRHLNTYYSPGDNGKDVSRMLVPALFTINLMHCKNVHLVEEEPTKRERRMASKHGKPLYRYHVLKVATGKGAYSGAKDTGIKMSHHICRGHFRTYEDHSPLFGKYVGTFWIPSHVRGRESEGIVEKDYEVIP